MKKRIPPFFVPHMTEFRGDVPLTFVTAREVDGGGRLEVSLCRYHGSDALLVVAIGLKTKPSVWIGIHPFTSETAHETCGTGECVGGVPLIFNGHGAWRLDHDGRGADHALTILFPRCWHECPPKSDAA